MPFRVGGEKTEPAMGVDVPELRRDWGRDAVEAKIDESEGFGSRYGKSDTEEEGDVLCLGSTIEPSDSEYWGALNGVASDEGVIRVAVAPCSGGG